MKAGNISEHDAATAHAASIKAEAASRGLAAQRAVEATGAQLLNDHADVAGHGWTDGRSDRDWQERREGDRQPKLQLPRIDLSVAYEPAAELIVGAGRNGHHEPGA